MGLAGCHGLRDARTVRDVRGSDGAGADPEAGLWRDGSEGGDVRLARVSGAGFAAEPHHPGDRRGAGAAIRRAATVVLPRTAVLSLLQIPLESEAWRTCIPRSAAS